MLNVNLEHYQEDINKTKNYKITTTIHCLCNIIIIYKKIKIESEVCDVTAIYTLKTPSAPVKVPCSVANTNRPLFKHYDIILPLSLAFEKKIGSCDKNWDKQAFTILLVQKQFWVVVSFMIACFYLFRRKSRQIPAKSKPSLCLFVCK